MSINQKELSYQDLVNTDHSKLIMDSHTLVLPVRRIYEPFRNIRKYMINQILIQYMPNLSAINPLKLFKFEIIIIDNDEKNIS